MKSIICFVATFLVLSTGVLSGGVVMYTSTSKNLKDGGSIVIALGVISVFISGLTMIAILSALCGQEWHPQVHPSPLPQPPPQSPLPSPIALRTRPIVLTIIATPTTPQDPLTCAICLEDLEPPYAQTRCNHQYHLSCISTWMTKSSNPPCPTCMQPLAINHPIP